MTFMCEPKSTLKIASVERSIKIAMSGLALVNEATEAINKTKTKLERSSPRRNVQCQ